MNSKSLKYFLFRRPILIKKDNGKSSKASLFRFQSDLAEALLLESDYYGELYGVGPKDKEEDTDTWSKAKDSVRIAINQVLKPANRNYHKEMPPEMREAILEIITKRIDPDDPVFENLELEFDSAYSFQKNFGSEKQENRNHSVFREFKKWQSQATRIFIFDRKPAELDWLTQYMGDEDDEIEDLINTMLKSFFRSFDGFVEKPGAGHPSLGTRLKNQIEMDGYKGKLTLERRDWPLRVHEQVQYNFFLASADDVKLFWESLLVFILTKIFEVTDIDEQKDLRYADGIGQFLRKINQTETYKGIEFAPLLRVFVADPSLIAVPLIYFESINGIEFNDNLLKEGLFHLTVINSNLQGITKIPEDDMAFWKSHVLYPTMYTESLDESIKEIKFEVFEGHILRTKRIKVKNPDSE